MIDIYIFLFFLWNIKFKFKFIDRIRDRNKMVFMFLIEYISYVRDINNIYLYVFMFLVMCV